MLALKCHCGDLGKPLKAKIRPYCSNCNEGLHGSMRLIYMVHSEEMNILAD